VAVGEGIEVVAKVRLGILEPGEVVVEAYYSRLRPDGALANGRGTALEWAGCDGGEHLYRGMVPSKASGMHGYSIRVLPCHDDVLVPHELPLITWEETEG
jgi:starch phosphorylase